MSWTVTAEKSPIAGVGNALTITSFVNDQTGKSFETEIRYDGSMAGWEEACVAAVSQVDSQSKPKFVQSGTVFVIPDVQAPIDTQPQSPEFLVWYDKWVLALDAERKLKQRIGSMTQERVDALIADQQKSYDPSFETLI